MASAGFVKHLECSICYELYEKPHMLKCLHTFCLKCLTKLNSSGSIRCPECREKTSFKDIQKDFRIEGIVETYLESESKECHPRTERLALPSVCICEDLSKPIVALCESCDEYLCNGCKLAHKKMKISRHHQIQDTPSLKSDVDACVATITERLSELKQQENIVHMAILEIKQNDHDQEIKVNQSVARHIFSVEKYRKEMIKCIRDVSDSQLNSLTDKQQMLHDFQLKLRTQKDSLVNVKQSEDFAGISKELISFGNTFKEENYVVVAKFVNMKTKADTRVRVFQKNTLDMQCIVDVKSAKKEYKRETPYSSKESSNYKELVKDCYKQVNSVKLHSHCFPEEICVVGEGAWCNMAHVIHVYDNNCQRSKIIDHEGMKAIRGITQVNNSEVVVSCTENQGLHQLASSGGYICKVSSGDFGGCCTFSGKLYIIDLSSCSVIVMENMENHWWQAASIKMNYNGMHSLDKIGLFRSNIYISSFVNGCLYDFNYSSKTLQKIEGSTSNKLSAPRLCGIDIEGNLLVADCDHSGIQVYSAERKWHRLTLPGLERPRWLAVQSSWLWATEDCQLKKYQIAK